MSYRAGFGSNNYRVLNNDREAKLADSRIWKKLHSPEYTLVDPFDASSRNTYPQNSQDNLQKAQMARRMDRKVIKLEAAFGSQRESVVVTRSQDLTVRDVMEEIQRAFKIPIDELVLFHKGTNLSDFPNERLENLGVENNQQIRVTRDPELPKRTPRSKLSNQFQQPLFSPSSNNLDPVTYLKEISPQRVPDPTPFQVQMYNQNLNQINEVLKLYVSFGSEREYVMINGKKPLLLQDLKRELNRVFKISPDQQCIVFKGYNLHEYLEDAPLEAFGLENNSPISLWPKGNGPQMDIRLPRGQSPPPQPNMPDIFSPRIPPPPGSLSSRWSGAIGEPVTEVLKVEIQHGSDRHWIILKGQNKNLTVLDLQNELEKVTSVAVRDQKLYFKSQELHNTPFKTLKECQLENNNVVKMVGDPSKIRYSNYFGRLAIPVQQQQQQQQQPPPPLPPFQPVPQQQNMFNPAQPPITYQSNFSQPQFPQQNNFGYH